jgi:histidine triad (HIT) family protein
MSSPESCAFCQIADGRTDAAVVFRDDAVLAFLDHRPLFAGHCLLIPRTHYSSLADLPSEIAGRLFDTARLLAAAMETGLSADGAFVAINNRVSQSVPHVHIHVVPRRRRDGLKGFFWPRSRYGTPGEMEVTRAALEIAVQGQRKFGSR